MSNKAFDTAANAGSSREHFASRIGFILIAAGCAIGIGNVWRFPYITGEYGGGAFVLLYLIFLVILGLPVMVMEFAVGRAAQKSAAQAFDILEPNVVFTGFLVGIHWLHDSYDVLYHGCWLDARIHS